MSHGTQRPNWSLFYHDQTISINWLKHHWKRATAHMYDNGSPMLYCSGSPKQSLTKNNWQDGSSNKLPVWSDMADTVPRLKKVIFDNGSEYKNNL